jgi:uncharacterized protein (TIGR02145 family)
MGINSKAGLSVFVLAASALIFSAGCSKDEGSGKTADLSNPNSHDTTMTTGVVSEGTIDYVTDIDGNKYKTIVIGTQTWMAENLKVTKLNDGSPVPNVADGMQWVRLSTPGYCWYANNETDNRDTYGALYNWYAVNTGKLAPAGWHVATQDEWTNLINYLGGEEKAGGKMKEAGLVYWNSPNADATNVSGFSARAGGGRDCFCSGTHQLMNKGYWWTATASDKKDFAFYHFLDRETGAIDNTNDVLNYKVFGFSVRCIKD